MKKFIILFCILLISCGGIDLTPKRYKIKNFVFKFEKRSDVVEKQKLKKLMDKNINKFYNNSKKFRKEVGKEIGDDFGEDGLIDPKKVVINVTNEKPITPIREKKVCGFTYPEDHSFVWKEGILDDSCFGHEFRLHLVNLIFPGQSELEDIKWMEEKEIISN